MTKKKILPLLITITIFFIGLFYYPIIDWFLELTNSDLEVDQILGLWIPMSILILLLWALMMGDPGGSEIANLIITIICGLLALPLTLLGIFVFCIVIIIQKENETPK